MAKVGEEAWDGRDAMGDAGGGQELKMVWM